MSEFRRHPEEGNSSGKHSVFLIETDLAEFFPPPLPSTQDQGGAAEFYGKIRRSSDDIWKKEILLENILFF
ncbi:hypothetical protein DLM75_12070 [Leptospira stimsonii]|uniref:Uncharacterized protein n=1 Tax=Leptospira stimsonii TaxID=2202203 RepID=A0A396Z7K8_9LEPT|nr:hypothetical protein DLM75_12070 [Leptospira stimsonii]